MLETIKRLALGVILIALAAGVLLYTDRGSRNRARRGPGAAPSHAGKVVRVALVQSASLPAFDEGGSGLLEVLTARGYSDGDRIQLRRFNAEADIGTANAIAKEVTTGSYDLIISLSRVMNRARQDSITTEIMEIVSGAEALRGSKKKLVSDDFLADTIEARQADLFESRTESNS